MRSNKHDFIPDAGCFCLNEHKLRSLSVLLPMAEKKEYLSTISWTQFNWPQSGTETLATVPILLFFHSCSLKLCFDLANVICLPDSPLPWTGAQDGNFHLFPLLWIDGPVNFIGAPFYLLVVLDFRPASIATVLWKEGIKYLARFQMNLKAITRAVQLSPIISIY